MLAKKASEKSKTIYKGKNRKAVVLDAKPEVQKKFTASVAS